MAAENIATQVKEALQDLAVKDNQEVLQRFFKTGEGQYGEGDVFIGVKVPEQRSVARAFFKSASLEDIALLLEDKVHEYRQTALFMLVLQYEKSKSLAERKAIFDFYISYKNRVNNWDLVDGSTHKIVGPYLHETNNFDYLYQLAAEEDMWTKRIAVVALWYLWKQGYVTEGLKLILQNLEHPHDLMHKANGWMLRELANKKEDVMLDFVRQHYDKMPRTTLRYAIEKLDPMFRKSVLQGEF